MNNFYQSAFYLLVGLIVGFILATVVFYKPAVTEVQIVTQPVEQVIVGDTLAELNEGNLMKEILRQGLKHPEIVLAQAKLETGYFKSDVCKQYNNLFGLRGKNGYYRFESWQASVKAYRDYVQYRYEGGNYYQFLKRIGYAEDPNYERLVSGIVMSDS